MKIIFIPYRNEKLWQRPGECMIVIRVHKHGEIGYQFMAKDINQRLVQAIATHATRNYKPLEVEGYAGMEAVSAATAATILRPKADLVTEISLILVDLHNKVLASGRSTNWAEAEANLNELAPFALYRQLKDYIDDNAVRGFADLPTDLAAAAIASCPEEVVSKGLHEAMDYLKPSVLANLQQL